MEDDIQKPLITPERMMRPQSNLQPELEPHLEENASLRKRAKYLERCKERCGNTGKTSSCGDVVNDTILNTGKGKVKS